jgi:hypothetical protein
MPQTIDQMREEFAPLEGYRRVPLHHTLHPEFGVVDGVLAITLDDLDATPTEETPQPRSRYRLTREMWDAIAADLGAGSRFLRQQPPNLILPLINRAYGNAQAEHPQVSMLAREHEGRQYAVDILKRRANPISPTRAIEVVHEVLSNGHVPEYSLSWRDGLKNVTFGAVTQAKQYEVRGRQVGDMVSGGVLVQLSPVGAIPLTASPYVERLVCTNGMTSTTGLDSWTTPGGDGSHDPYDWLAEAVEAAYNAVDRQFEEIQRAANTPIEERDIEVIVNDLFDHYRIPTALRQSVVRRLANQNTDNLWDVLNAFTWAGTHDQRINDPSMRVRLMRTAGDIPTHAERCESCHRLVA